MKNSAQAAAIPQRRGFQYLMVILAISGVLLWPLVAAAQEQPDTPTDPEVQREAERVQREMERQTCAACGACGGGIGAMVLALVGFFVLNIALLVWVARDAKSRNMDNAVLWMVLVMFTSVLGLIIYIFARPQGNLVKCPSCGNNKLRASAKCPHCGNP